MQEYRSRMLAASLKNTKKKSFSSLQPVLPLIPEVVPNVEAEKNQFISLELQTQAGGSGGQTYKKYVRKFDEGTPQQWLDLLEDLEEIWTQNGVKEGKDRVATVRSVLRGDSLNNFNSSIDEEKDPDDSSVITIGMVNKALKSVTQTIFPHRALEIQKLWMQRGMKKPFALSTRKTAAAIVRINNSLPLFPGATEESRFSATEIIGLLEWCLPQAWRAKFDLDGYVPTLGTKTQLIEACEAIERSQQATTKEKKEKKAPKTNPKGEKKSYYCSLHGKNPTHNTADCWTLKNKKEKEEATKKASNTKTNHKNFSKKAFTKELNLLSCSSSKKEVLEKYSLAIAQEKAKLEKQKKKRKERDSDTSDSDSSHSVGIIELPNNTPKKTKHRVRFDEPLEEEKAFLEQCSKPDEDLVEIEE